MCHTTHGQSHAEERWVIYYLLMTHRVLKLLEYLNLRNNSIRIVKYFHLNYVLLVHQEFSKTEELVEMCWYLTKIFDEFTYLKADQSTRQNKLSKRAKSRFLIGYLSEELDAVEEFKLTKNCSGLVQLLALDTFFEGELLGDQRESAVNEVMNLC